MGAAHYITLLAVQSITMLLCSIALHCAILLCSIAVITEANIAQQYLLLHQASAILLCSIAVLFFCCTAVQLFAAYSNGLRPLLAAITAVVQQ